MSKPTCIIIAGPNGSGKTTFALDYLENVVGFDNFINADLIASGLSPLSPEKHLLTASKLFLKEINKAIEARENISFETTLSGKSYLKLIRKLKNNGWRVELIYLYLPSVQLSIKRVAERVIHGGHNIPKATIIRRYPRSLGNLINHYAKLCDTTICLDNSNQQQNIIFSQNFEFRQIQNNKLYQQLLKNINNE
jgi:predicted ABC-type ATPase